MKKMKISESWSIKSFKVRINSRFKIAVKGWEPRSKKLECAVAVIAICLKPTIITVVEEETEHENDMEQN